MNTNKYELDSTDEMLKLSDVDFDQNIPVQGPEAQALEVQGPENQAPEDQAPEALQLAAPEDPIVTEASDDSSRAIDQLLKVGMSRADAEMAMMDETLNEIALSDPKVVKRKWENRQSATRSRKRKAERKATLETQINTLRTQRAALVDREDLCKKDVDALKQVRTQLRSNVEAIDKQNLLLYLRSADLRIKAGQVDPNSGPPGMMIPFGVPHNHYAQNSGPPGMMTTFGVRHNNFAPNSGPPGMTMPFCAPHNNLALNPNQQARLVPPRRTLLLLEGADAGGSDAEGGDDAPGQGP